LHPIKNQGGTSQKIISLIYENLKLLSKWEKQEALLPQMSVKILSIVETSCTTNPQQIVVMELEGYRRSTCSKQPRLIRLSSTSSIVDNYNDFCCQHNQLPGVWDKISKGSTPILVKTQCGINERKRPCRKPASFRPVISIQYWLVTDRPTDGQ